MNQALMILLLALGAHSSSAVGLPEMNPVVARVQQQDIKSISSVREMAHVPSLDSSAMTLVVPHQKVSVIKTELHEREINQRIDLYLKELVKQINQTEFQGDGTAERLAECLFPKTKEGGTRKC